MEDSLNILISAKYDNEINIYKLIKFERTILFSKMIYNYTNSKLEKYFKISYSINRVKNKIKKVFN